MLSRHSRSASRWLSAKRPYSGPGEDYFQLQKIHAKLKDVEDLYAKYRMDRFTEHSQVDEMLRKGLLDEAFANNIKAEIDVQKEAASTKQFTVV